MSGKYWYVGCYQDYLDNTSRARIAFKAFAEAGYPVLLFENTVFKNMCVAVYGTDEEILSVKHPMPDETYAGLVRVLELFRIALLVDVANFPTRNIDDIIMHVRRMRDQ